MATARNENAPAGYGLCGTAKGWASASSTRWTPPLEKSRPVLAEPYEAFRNQHGNQPNSPKRAAQILAHTRQRLLAPGDYPCPYRLAGFDADATAITWQRILSAVD